MSEHLDETHHRQLLDVMKQPNSGVAHRVAANSNELVRCMSRTQLPRDSRRVQVAGGLTGDE
jgi:hypothetical protein